MKTRMQCLAFAALLGLAGQASASTFTVYDSGNTGELITSVPNDNTFRVLYSVDVGTLAVGDILVVVADGGQLQDPTTTTDFYLTSWLVRGDSATATGGTELDDSNAFNISHQSYRGVLMKPAISTVKSGTTGRHFVNLLVQAHGDLNVILDSGRLQVLKITP